MQIFHVNYVKARLKNPTHGAAGNNISIPASDLSKRTYSMNAWLRNVL